MKHTIIVLMIFLFATQAQGQDSSATEPAENPYLLIETDDNDINIEGRKLDVKVKSDETKVRYKGPVEVEHLETDSTKAKTVVRIGNWKVRVDESRDGNDRVEILRDTSPRELKTVRTKFGMFDLGVNTILYNGQLQLPEPYEQLEDLNYWRSTYFALHLLKQRVNIYQHKLHLTYGLSFNFNNYNFSKNFTIVPEADVLTLRNDTIDYRKNKLHTLFFTLPIQFGYESNPYNRKSSFRIGAGGSFGILVKGKTKQKIEIFDKIKEKDNFNLNKIRYGINTYIGYGWINFFANYYFSPLFDNGEAPAFNPLEFGIVLRGF